MTNGTFGIHFKHSNLHVHASLGNLFIPQILKSQRDLTMCKEFLSVWDWRMERFYCLYSPFHSIRVHSCHMPQLWQTLFIAAETATATYRSYCYTIPLPQRPTSTVTITFHGCREHSRHLPKPLQRIKLSKMLKFMHKFWNLKEI